MRRTGNGDNDGLPPRPFNIWDNIDLPDDQTQRDQAPRNTALLNISAGTAAVRQPPRQPQRTASAVSTNDQQLAREEPTVEQRGSIRIPALDPGDTHDFGVNFHQLLQAVLPPAEYEKWQDIKQVEEYFASEHPSDSAQGTFPPLQIDCNHRDDDPECICRGICIDCGFRMPMMIMQNYSRSREELPQGVLDNGYGIVWTFPAYVCQRVVNRFGKTIENHVARIGTKNPDNIREVKCKKSRNTFIGVNDHIKANLEKIMKNADAAGGDSDAQWTAYLTLPHTLRKPSRLVSDTVHGSEHTATIRTRS